MAPVRKYLGFIDQQQALVPALIESGERGTQPARVLLVCSLQSELRGAFGDPSHFSRKFKRADWRADLCTQLGEKEPWLRSGGERVRNSLYRFLFLLPEIAVAYYVSFSVSGRRQVFRKELGFSHSTPGMQGGR